MKSNHEIFVGNNGYINVTFTFDVSTENDSFSHEFGVESYPDHFLLNEVTWDDSEHTDLENAVIQYYVIKNWDVLSDEAVRLAEERKSDYDLEKAFSRAEL